MVLISAEPESAQTCESMLIVHVRTQKPYGVSLVGTPPVWN